MVELLQNWSTVRIVRLIFILLISNVFCKAKAETSVWDGHSYSIDWYANASGSTYHIKSAADLAGLSYCFANGFYLYGNFEGRTIILDNDIDLAGHEWTPIGMVDDTNTYYEFAGTFDGNNHTIKGMKITKHNEKNIHVGLFGCNFSNNFAVKNLRVEGEINLDNLTGGYDGSKVYVGGIVGYTSANAVENCQTDVNISVTLNNGTSRSVYCGGIIGFIEQSNIIDLCKYCYTKGDINVILNNANKGYVGGLIGGSSCKNAVISCCASQSNIKAANGKFTYVGGIVGEADMQRMENALYTGSITLDYPNYGFAGGMLGGDRTENNYFKNCLMLGTMSKNSGTAYLVPIVSATMSGTTGDNCYYITGIPNNKNFGTEKSESELKSGTPLSGFDTSIWEFKEGSYPNLQFLKTYTLSITTRGNGSVVYDGLTIRNQSSSFAVNNGTNVSLILNHDNGYRIKSVKVNSNDATSSVSNNTYTISNISRDITVEVEFGEEINAFTVSGVNYSVKSSSNGTVVVAKGNYGTVLEIPAKVIFNASEWSITGFESGALVDSQDLCAIIWNPEVAFTENVNNPNLLLYVKSSSYAPSSIQNVVVNGTASNIVLKEAQSGNSFYCPQSFVAQKISFTHNYKMQTGLGESKGWETIALPFDVQTITHETKGTIVPFAQWKNESNKKPFWLMELTGTGFVEAGSIKAYTPYIISMPNHPQYESQWLQNGKVTFAASSVTIGKTENLNQSFFNGRTFIPCFAWKKADEGFYALNVSNDFEVNNSGTTEGSMFVWKLRNVHPFEAYLTASAGAPLFIDIFEDMATDISVIEEEQRLAEEAVYDLQGRKVNAPSKKGIYIKHGKKLIIK